MAKIDAKHREKLKTTNRILNSNPEWKIPTRIAKFLFKQRFLTQLTKTVGEKSRRTTIKIIKLFLQILKDALSTGTSTGRCVW